MAITLKQALKIGGLKHCEVVAGGEGLDRPLDYVTIMEVPDIVRWLKGKELLLTSLYPIKDDKEAVDNLVRELHDKGTSALAIKPHRFIEEIPDVILDEANKYGFPILAIPEHISYLDILSPVMNVIFDERVVIQEDLELAYRLLDEIKNSKGGIRQLTETLAHLMKHEIRIESFVPYLNIPFDQDGLAPLNGNQKKELELIQRPVRMTRWNEDTNEYQECLIAPVIIEGQMLGAITSIGIAADFLEVDLAILERANTILSLEFMRKKAAYELEQQYKSHFFKDLLFSKIQYEAAMLEKGKMYGFDVEKRYIFTTVEFTNREKGITFISDIVNRLELICAHIDEDIIIGAVQNGLYLLYPSAGKKPERIDADLQSILSEMQSAAAGDVYIGVSRATKDIGEIRDGYEQAQQAVILGRNLYQSRHIIYYEELGFYRLLAEIDNINEIKKFYNESIGSLIEYDKTHDLELVHSLTTYFQNNESLSKTANELYVHINTMKYRLQRIKTITNLDVKNTEDKLNLHIGLKIHNFSKNDYRFR
ncbi:PucR family transcriptional regulator [Salimicrobium halophilum]|uniref:Purine catabolism regulatory protein n=1 Tax=Salimicrobium halophilum TaxID=86666 RepID=A0A1G8UGZ1_9BACI|nr:PucR family transcriptional regulator [Salimicrobium halophilum]SDJ53008.1 purine catabolism regulatory protein [Salimicrobium halophilum]